MFTHANNQMYNKVMSCHFLPIKLENNILKTILSTDVMTVKLMHIADSIAN